MSCRNWTVAAAVIVAPIGVITLRVLETLDQAGVPVKSDRRDSETETSM